ncbi:MAG TPA: hypothetical protein PLR50_08805 [Candidatus Rifleibacterium sp.]|nr:hypothetical protein [Candidatus Rifleibacterium sp.]HQB83582.1 hypothetical protein [Candidatus Rifleibacterium sp.]
MKITRVFPAFMAMIVASAIFCAAPGFSQADHPVVEALKPKYGNVMVKDLENQYEFTLSLPFNEIENALNLVVSQEWYPTWISVSARPDEKAAINFTASATKNESAKRFSMLQELVSPGMLPWKTTDLDDKMPGVTAVETNFAERVSVIGETLKSGLIFSHLFPMIKRVTCVSDPFFERGSYSDTPAGRVMNFTVKCNW